MHEDTLTAIDSEVKAIPICIHRDLLENCFQLTLVVNL